MKTDITYLELNNVQIDYRFDDGAIEVEGIYLVHPGDLDLLPSKQRRAYVDTGMLLDDDIERARMAAVEAYELECSRQEAMAEDAGEARAEAYREDMAERRGEL